MTAKQKAWKICSRYIRLRDALKYCKGIGLDLHQFIRPEDIIGHCCTCERVKSWIYMDAGHWINRGSGGGSGVYFDERNIHLQCKPCNGNFYQGKVQHDVKGAYDNFMLESYGQKVLDELKVKDKMVTRNISITYPALYQFYKEYYQGLVDSL